MIIVWDNSAVTVNGESYSPVWSWSAGPVSTSADLVPGAEYVLPSNRMHYVLPAARMHYIAKEEHQ